MNTVELSKEQIVHQLDYVDKIISQVTVSGDNAILMGEALKVHRALLDILRKEVQNDKDKPAE